MLWRKWKSMLAVKMHLKMLSRRSIEIWLKDKAFDKTPITFSKVPPEVYYKKSNRRLKNFYARFYTNTDKISKKNRKLDARCLPKVGETLLL